MKKLVFMLMLLLLVSSLFVGCGKKSTSTSPDDGNSINPEDYTFLMGIMTAPEWKGNYYITFSSEKDSITSVELKIDNEPVEVSHYSYPGMEDQWFVSDYNFNENQTYQFEVRINDSKSVSNFNLKITDIVTANWPETYDPTVATTINWTQAHNAMYQEFDGYAYKWDTDEEVDKDKELSPGARSYTIPADWLPTGYDEYDLTVVTANYHTDSKLFASSISISDAMYSTREKKGNSIQKFNRLVKKLAKVVKY